MATKSEFECRVLHSKTKTLVVEANFTPAINDESASDIQVYDSKYSRFKVTIIDTEAEQKDVSANIKVTKESDAFVRMAEAGIERVISGMYTTDDDSCEESVTGGTSPAYTHILFSEPFRGKTVAMVLTGEDAESNKMELGKIYKELLETSKQYPENLPEMDAIMDGSRLLKEGKIIRAGVPDQKENPAYAQMIYSFKKTAAEILADPGNEEKLRKTYFDLERNKDKYKNNAVQMRAIAEGLSLQRAGALKKMKSSAVLYKCGPKANSYKAGENELCPCTEMTLSLFPGDNSPFVLTIENFKAPVNKDDSGRTNPVKSKAEKYVKHDFRISLYDMIGLVSEMKRQVNAYFYANYEEAYLQAAEEMRRRRQEWKEDAE